MIDRHFQVWDNRLYVRRESGGGYGLMEGDVFWFGGGAGLHLWSGSIRAVTIAHESMHGMYWDEHE
jgi:hypothetical protein